MTSWFKLATYTDNKVGFSQNHKLVVWYISFPVCTNVYGCDNDMDTIMCVYVVGLASRIQPW